MVLSLFKQTAHILQLVLSHFVESLGNVIHIVSVQSSNGDTSIHGQIDMELLNAALHLLLGQTSVSEH